MDYSATIHVPLPPDRAARRIHDDLEFWWSTRVERHAKGFTVWFGASHATFAIAPGASNRAFQWICTDAHMIIENVADAAEWTGTDLLWSIAPAMDGSAITLTHRGLTPEIACFDVCCRGWQHFFEGSLRKHLCGARATPETGQQPT